MRFFDLTLPLGSGLPVWPGDPPFALTPEASLEGGDGLNLSSLCLSAHAGTHVDAPRHYLADGPAVDQLPLASLVGPARVVEFPGPGHLTAQFLAGAGLAAPLGRVLLKTPNSRFWAAGEGEFRPDFTALTPGAAAWLVAEGASLVGVDYLSVDPWEAAGAPAHQALLAAGVVIVEGLDLSQVPPGDYHLACLPLKIVGGDGAPCRAVLWRD
ncbi:MAG: cyclase family protein [Deltaproteobacteria bacterium]|nr:cyclase family protein [Deltaproteobacteria bacterium]